MTNAIAGLLNALANALEAASDGDSNHTSPIDPTFTINIRQGNESNPSVQFVIDKNTTLTDPNILGPVLSVLISRVINLRNGNNQDASVPQVQRMENDTGLTLSGDSIPTNSAVRGMVRRFIRGLSNRVE